MKIITKKIKEIQSVKGQKDDSPFISPAGLPAGQKLEFLEPRLTELLEKITDSNIQSEIQAGIPAGKEIW
jgi:antitoxin component of MazEF toxin-antitoxin module